MRSLHVIVTAVLLMLSCWSCLNHKDDQNSQLESVSVTFPDTSSLKGLSGQQLAYVYCQRCHLFPDPAHLTKAIWEEQVLPGMAQRLGVKTAKNPYVGMSYDEIQAVSRAGIFPFEEKITPEAWQKLTHYYLSQAPDSMAPQAIRKNVARTLPFFSVHEISLDNQSPLTTLVSLDTTHTRLRVGSARKSIKTLDEKLQIIDSMATHSPPVAMVEKDGIEYLLEIGIMNPSDQPEGKLVPLQGTQLAPALLDSLPRPVYLSVADLNQDGRQDYLVSGFGYRTGKLSWYEGSHAANMKEHVLVDQAGAIKTIIHDLNEDGLPDIIALMAQGDERVIIFYNQGKGAFTPKTVLRFPPEYGTSYFELADFNNDGKPDILCVQGDNADYSFALKNYHGIRIFENQGQDQFREVFFYPLYGATMTHAEDFDQDGDLDIATTAFFADFEHAPEQGFLYLENRSPEGYQFKGYTFAEARKGRWLVFDTGDIDKDGDKDMVLGSFVYSPTPTPKEIQQAWIKDGPEVLILENRLR